MECVAWEKCSGTRGLVVIAPMRRPDRRILRRQRSRRAPGIRKATGPGCFVSRVRAGRDLGSGDCLQGRARRACGGGNGARGAPVPKEDPQERAIGSARSTSAIGASSRSPRSPRSRSLVHADHVRSRSKRARRLTPSGSREVGCTVGDATPRRGPLTQGRIAGPPEMTSGSSTTGAIATRSAG
jgi:hypothetical protein